HNVAGHFGVALKSIRKNDRHFDDLHALTPQLVRHLDLKTVAIGVDLIEMDGFQSAAAEAFVAAGWVGERHAGNYLDILGRAFAQHQPAERPIDDANAIQITRAKDEVGIFSALEEHRYVIRVVRQIAIKFENELVISLQRPFESGD